MKLQLHIHSCTLIVRNEFDNFLAKTSDSFMLFIKTKTQKLQYGIGFGCVLIIIGIGGALAQQKTEEKVPQPDIEQPEDKDEEEINEEDLKADHQALDKELPPQTRDELMKRVNDEMNDNLHNAAAVDDADANAAAAVPPPAQPPSSITEELPKLTPLPKLKAPAKRQSTSQNKDVSGRPAPPTTASGAPSQQTASKSKPAAVPTQTKAGSGSAGPASPSSPALASKGASPGLASKAGSKAGSMAAPASSPGQSSPAGKATSPGSSRRA